MRVSTSQFYLQSAQQMSQKSAEVNDQVAYLTSGKRVLTAKDDPLSYGTLAGFNDDLAHIEKYKGNINQAENHNSLQEVVFSGAEDILNTMKDHMLRANSGAMSTDDRQALAQQTRNSFNQLMDAANSQNENGDYIFSGYQTKQQPFNQNVDGTVAYQGDSGIRELQVAKNIKIATNQAGDAAFMTVNNALGDFSANYDTNTSGIALASATITDRNTYNSAMAQGYTFSFADNNAQSSPDLTVTNRAGESVFSATPYIAGQPLAFGGIEVTLSGNPLPGDSFTLTEQADISIFDTINQAIAWMDQGVVSTNTEQHQVDYNATLDQLSTATSHITSRRVDSGMRLQLLESQSSRHLDTELNLASGKAAIEDLDFAQAIAQFEQSKIALQASQQAFSKVQGLSLFNYI